MKSPEDFLKEDMDNTRFENETIKSVAVDVMEILRNHGLDVRSSLRVIDVVRIKVCEISNSVKV